MPSPSDQSHSKAPLVVFGGMLAIALAGLLIVLISHCRRDEPYMDPDRIERGQPGHVYPPTDPPPKPATP